MDKTCELISSAIDDEEEATKIYENIKNNIKDKRVKLLIDSIQYDEQKHFTLLTGLYKILCKK